MNRRFLCSYFTHSFATFTRDFIFLALGPECCPVDSLFSSMQFIRLSELETDQHFNRKLGIAAEAFPSDSTGTLIFVAADGRKRRTTISVGFHCDTANICQERKRENNLQLETMAELKLKREQTAWRKFMCWQFMWSNFYAMCWSQAENSTHFNTNMSATCFSSEVGNVPKMFSRHCGPSIKPVYIYSSLILL